MSVERNCNPSKIRRKKEEDIVISIGIRDGDGGIVFLSNNQTHPQIENPEINNTINPEINKIPSPNTEFLFREKVIPSTNLPKRFQSKEDTVKEDKVIDVGFLDEDGKIVRLSNNQS